MSRVVVGELTKSTLHSNRELHTRSTPYFYENGGFRRAIPTKGHVVRQIAERLAEIPEIQSAMIFRRQIVICYESGTTASVQARVSDALASIIESEE